MFTAQLLHEYIDIRANQLEWPVHPPTSVFCYCLYHKLVFVSLSMGDRRLDGPRNI